MPAIQTTNLTKQYSSTIALNSLDLTIRRGEVYGFLGPNGAGKSTTIDLLMDYIRPTSGHASVLGYNPQVEASDVHSRVGILPDQFGVYATLTGRQHVEFIIDAKGVDDDSDELLTRVGLEDAAGKTARSYSRGMQQRLGLAMALVGNPDLLILDEPFSGLDPYGVRLVREIVIEQKAQGTTVFFSSHVLDQVERVCDRIGLLANGELVAEGTPTEIREQAGVVSELVFAFNDISGTYEQVLERVWTVDGVTTAEIDDQKRLLVTYTEPDVQMAVFRAVEDVASTASFNVDQGTIEDAFIAMSDVSK